jgi:hypothetical protein
VDGEIRDPPGEGGEGLTIAQTAVACLAQLAMALAVAGLLFRGHAGLCRAFVAYLTFALTCNVLITVWPDEFFTMPFWIFEQFVLDILKIAIGLEIAYWTFLGFEGARDMAKGALFLLLVGTLAAVLALHHEDAEGVVLLGLQPRMATATVWLFTALAALIAWYRIPAHPVHMGIMVGFVPYLVIFTTVLRFMTAFGWGETLATLDPMAYAVACAWWAKMAWRPAPALDPVLARLQPWRVR